MARAGYCKHVFHSNCLVEWFKKQQVISGLYRTAHIVDKITKDSRPKYYIRISHLKLEKN